MASQLKIYKSSVCVWARGLCITLSSLQGPTQHNINLSQHKDRTPTVQEKQDNQSDQIYTGSSTEHRLRRRHWAQISCQILFVLMSHFQEQHHRILGGASAQHRSESLISQLAFGTWYKNKRTTRTREMATDQCKLASPCQHPCKYLNAEQLVWTNPLNDIVHCNYLWDNTHTGLWTLVKCGLLLWHICVHLGCFKNWPHHRVTVAVKLLQK